jgi:hypothetical protein
MSDEVQDIIMVSTPTDAEQDAMEQAFKEGQRSVAIANGRIVWTTAPKDYDGGGAIELEVLGDYFGRPLRKIAVDPEDYQWQIGRYASGTYGVWNQDPLEEERRYREAQANRDAERAAAEAKHKAGLEWLRTASETELADEDLCWERGCKWQDVRDEKQRRREAAEISSRASAWERAASLIPEGATLIDEGEYIRPTMPGMRPIQRPARVHYNVSIVRGWPADDVERAEVHESTGRGTKAFGTLAHIAGMISKGQIRIAQPGEVPPRAVVERIGHEQIKNIRRLEAAGKVVWGGRPLFGSEVLILDDSGKLVRAKKVLEAAHAAYSVAERAYWDAVSAKPAATATRDGPSGGGEGHAWGRARARRHPRRGLKGRYGRSGWYGERGRHAVAASKGWLRRRKRS